MMTKIIMMIMMIIMIIMMTKTIYFNDEGRKYIRNNIKLSDQPNKKCLPKSGPTYKGEVLIPRHQTPHGQPDTKTEMSLQNILVKNFKPINSVATNSNQYSQRRPEDRNAPGMCVIAFIPISRD